MHDPTKSPDGKPEELAADLEARHQDTPLSQMQAGVVMEIQRAAAETGMILTDDITWVWKPP